MPRPSSLLDTRVIYCGDNLEQLAKLPNGSVDLIYIDPPFNSNRNYEVFWGETKEKRAFRGSPRVYAGLYRVHAASLRGTGTGAEEDGSFYYHCDWHASHYVKVMLDQIWRKISKTRSSGNGPTRETPAKGQSTYATIPFFSIRRSSHSIGFTMELPITDAYVETFYKTSSGDPDGRRWKRDKKA
jgi:hypothetical protein